MAVISVSYDIFTEAFLDKVREYDLLELKDYERAATVDGYMRRAIAAFRSVCKYDFSTTGDKALREFDISVPESDIDELADIISEGMVAQWLKPYINQQDFFEHNLNTKDFTGYSRANLLSKAAEAGKQTQRNFVNMIREYSYVHGDLTTLHL